MNLDEMTVEQRRALVQYLVIGPSNIRTQRAKYSTPDMKCLACKRAIETGQRYRRKHDGHETVAVHEECLELLRREYGG
jgi:hypothetical protein